MTVAAHPQSAPCGPGGGRRGRAPSGPSGTVHGGPQNTAKQLRNRSIRSPAPEWAARRKSPRPCGAPIPRSSFRLGTVVRPIRDGIEACFDIDLVCEIPLLKDRTSPQAVKAMVGDRLREHGTYKELLDDEGRRCWTLEYAEQDGVGFHLDVLPAVPDARGLLDTAIAITNKSRTGYSWTASNPRGYGSWFDSKNADAFARVAFEQKMAIQDRESMIYASIDRVPDQLVRTPLQRSIQLMKRHRDICFNDHG